VNVLLHPWFSVRKLEFSGEGIMNALSSAAKGGSEPTAIVHSDNLTTDPRKGRTSVFQCNFENLFNCRVRAQRMIGRCDTAQHSDADP
jgi:hypothetical protein